MRRSIKLLTATAALTLSAQSAHAVYNPPPCPAEPSLAQCQNPAFMYGACGSTFLEDARTNPDAICNVLLEEAALAAAAGLASTDVIVPPVVDAAGGLQDGGGVDGARVAPRIDEAVDTVGGQGLANPDENAGLLIGAFWMNAAMNGEPDFPFPIPDPEPDPEPEPDQPPPPPPPAGPAPPATGHDAPVGDCSAYARDKFLTYTTFDDAASAIGEDHRAVFELAYGPINDPRSFATRTIGGMVNEGTDARTFTVDFPAGLQPKNTWFTAQAAPSQDYSVDPQIDPGDGTLRALKGVVFSNGWYGAILPLGQNDHIEDFGWHLNMSQALSGELDEKLIDLERQQADFAELLAKRAIAVDESIAGLKATYRTVFSTAMNDCIDDLPWPPAEDDPWSDPVSYCATEEVDMPALMAPYQAQVAARLAALDAAIEDGLDDASAAGCLNTNATTACDWSPRRFAQRMIETVGAQRQRAYEKCVAYTGDDFGALSDYTFTHPINLNTMYSRKDYTTSPAAVDTFTTRRDNWRNVLSDELDEVLDAEGTDDDSPALTGGASDAVEMGNSLFGASYAYDMKWMAFGLENGLCNLSATIDGSFEAKVSVLNEEQELVMADAHAGFDSIDVDLEIFDQSIIDVHQDLLDQDEYTLVDGESVQENDELIDETYRFTILGIPMSLQVGASGKVGLTYGLAAEIDRGGAACNSVSATLAGRLTPLVEFDGFAEVGVDFFIAKAGVKGDLALAHIRLPFTLEVGVEAAQGNAANLALVIESTLDAAIRVLDGKLSLFAEVGIGPFSESAEKTFFSWSGIETEFNVIDFDMQVPFASLLTWFSNPI